MNLNVCLYFPEPVNRVTAAREFRVFHAALHSLSSAYRDSVSRGNTLTVTELLRYSANFSEC